MADTEAPSTEPPSQNPLPNPSQAEPPPSQSANVNLNAMLHSDMFGDGNQFKKPRDARLVHMILMNQGVTSYAERVPLQLMDFAYRYTSSTLQDALHLTSEGYGPTISKGNDLSTITHQGLRLSIASRTHYQFSPTLPKEYYQEQAHERNKVALPIVGRDWGLRMPPEQYTLTESGWTLKEEWDEEVGEENGALLGDMDVERPVNGGNDEEDTHEEEEGGRMEDVFGDAGRGDQTMEDD